MDGKRYAYRSLWEKAHGPLQEGHVLHHVCHNPWCVNLDHLEQLTMAEHASRHLGDRNRQKGAERTHCRNGHPLEGDNLLWVNSGRDGRYRRCRVCSIDAKSRYRKKRI